jgi:hypothetical protein
VGSPAAPAANRWSERWTEIERSANRQSALGFPFTGSSPLGDFMLVDDGTAQSASSRILTDLVPGDHTVRELVPDDGPPTGVTCSDPTVVITDPEVAITLPPGASVACTYRDTVRGSRLPAPLHGDEGP